MTKSGLGLALGGAALACAALSCGGGDRGRIAFTLTLNGLAPLAAGQGWYEGFAIGRDGLVRSTGKFNLDPSATPALVFTPRGDVLGTTASATFGPANTYLGSNFPFIYDATSVFITIEPEGDADLVPSGNVILGGAVDATTETASLTVAGLTGSGGPGLADFTTAGGVATLTSPTDGPGNDAQGLWFTTDATGATPGLNLPVLSSLNAYEAFVTADGVNFTSLGRFRDPADFDFDFMSHGGRADPSVGFRAPGQDLVAAFSVARPSPVDVADGAHAVEITVEPAIDNAVGAFPLKVLSAPVLTDVVTSGGAASRPTNLVNAAATLPGYAATTTATSVTLTATTAPLGPLGAARDGRYELWAVVGGTPASCGAFVVDAVTLDVTSPSGATNYGPSTTFALTAANTGLLGAFPNAAAATELFVTVEPVGDAVAADSGVVVLAGAHAAGTAALTVAGIAGGRGIADFSAAAGSFVTVTPTDDAAGAAVNDRFGVWFRDFSFDAPTLVLPTLPSGWVYEGWVVDTGTGARTSTGRFRSGLVADDDAMTWPGRGTVSTGFNVPGQDFLVAVAPLAGVPTDLTTGYTVLVSVEPTPDNDLAPSPFVVLQGAVPASVGPFALANVFSGPTAQLAF